MSIPTLYTNYQECILDLDILGKIVSTPQQSMQDIKDALFEEFKRRKPFPTLEYKRYELSRLVSPAVKIAYDRELDLQDDESIVDLSLASNGSDLDFEDLTPLVKEVQEMFTYERGITDSLREEIIEKYDLNSGEMFKPGIKETEDIIGSVEVDESTILSNEEIDNLGSEKGVSIVNSEEILEEQNDELETEEEYIDTSDEVDDDDDDYDFSQEYVEAESVELEENTFEYDFGQATDTTNDEDDDYDFSQEESSDDDDDDYDFSQEEVSNDYEFEQEEPESVNLEQEDDSDTEDYYFDAENDDTEGYDFDAENDIEEYDFEEDENYTTASQVPTEVVNEFEVPAFESPPTSSFIDSVFDDDSLSFLTESVEELVVDIISTPTTPAQLSPPPKKEEVVDRSAEPTDLRQFLRKHPNCEYEFALKYFTKKQIQDALKMGKIVKKGNTLRG